MTMNCRPIQMLCFVVVLGIGCKKDDPEPEVETEVPQPDPAYRLSFSATRAFVDLGGVDPDTNEVASLSVRTSSGTAVALDSVKVNGILAIQVLSGFYLTDGNAGLDLAGEDLEWSATDASTGINVVQVLSGLSYPSVGQITSSETIPDGSGYTFACTGVTGADSVTFTLGPLSRTFAGNTTSCTFSAAEIQSLETEVYLGTITAVRSTINTLGDVRCRSAKAHANSRLILVE